MNSLLTQLTKICKQYKKTEEIEDIIIYGSTMRGKQNPNDIDILVLFKNKINKDKEYEIRKKLEQIKKIEIISKTKEQQKEDHFNAREGILFEGYSLLRNKYLCEEQGFKALGLFLYQTKKITNIQKTKFYHALNGRRNTEGLTQKLGIIKLSNNALVTELKNIEQTKEFLDKWVEYNYIPLLIPERLAHKKFLEKNSN